MSDIVIKPTAVAQKTHPDWLPVDKDDVKKDARMDLDTTLMDDTIERNIKLAIDQIEKYTSVVIRKSEFQARFDSFPVVMCLDCIPIDVTAVEVHYTDKYGESKQVDAENIEIQNNGTYYYLFFKKQYPVPSTSGTSGNVTVDFECGYSEAGDVPEELKQAIIIIAVNMMQGIDDCVKIPSLPDVVKSILRKYKSLRWMV